MKHIVSYMTPFPHTIDSEATLAEAKDIMASHRIRHLPVSYEGKIVGILSDRDIKWAMDPAFELGEDHQIKVKRIARKKPYVVPTETPAHEVFETMHKNKYGSALITKDEKLAGIFTATDACKICADLLKKEEGN